MVTTRRTLIGALGVSLATTSASSVWAAGTTSDGNSAIFNVRDFGALGDEQADDTQSIQNCIAAADGAPVYLPPGRYRITGTLEYDASKSKRGFVGQQAVGLKFFGAGQGVSVLVAEGDDGPVIKVHTGAERKIYNGHEVNGHHTVGTQLSSFSIEGKSGKRDGMEITCAHQFMIENIAFSRLGGTAIMIPMRYSGDVDACGHGTIQSCRIYRCGGDGIDMRSHVDGSVSTAYMTIAHNEVVACGGKGLVFSGAAMLTIVDNAVTQNVGGGIHGEHRKGIHNRNVHIERNELGNGQPFNIKMESLVTGRFINNRHIRNNGESGEHAIILGVPGVSVRNILSEQEYFIAGNDNTPYLAYEFHPEASCSRIRVIYPEWGQFGDPEHRRYSDPDKIAELMD